MVKKNTCIMTMFAGIVCLLISSNAPAVDKLSLSKLSGYKYHPYLNLEARKHFAHHNIRAAEVYDFFLPLGQKENELLFADLRVFDKSGTSLEVNVHLGYRQLMPDIKKIYGIYGAFDKRRSDKSNYFTQMVLGGEYWQDKWFLGGNIYKPIGRTKRYIGETRKEEQTERNLVITTNKYYEESLAGIDLELGYAFTESLTGYAGGYYFAGEDTNTVAGTKLRLAYDYFRCGNKKILKILDGVSLETGVQHDKPRGISGYIGVKLKVGLLPHETANISGFARHMVELVRRDPDIVTEKTKKTFRKEYKQPGKNGFVGGSSLNEKNDLSKWSTEKLLQELGLSKNATLKEIRKKYRALALKHHPDKGGKTEDFVKITNIHELLKNKLNPLHKNKSPSTNPKLDWELLKSVEKKDLKEVKEKLALGASPNSQDDNGTTALMFAIHNYDNAIIKVLVDKGALPNIQNKEGVTALMLATEQGKLPTIKKLLNYNADPNLKRKDKITTLAIAMNKKHHDIVSELLKGGAIPGLEQLRIFYNLQLFVDLNANGRSNAFKTKLEQAEGHCAGLTKLWLYSKWSTQEYLTGDYTKDWFQNTINTITYWDGSSKLDDETIQDINQFLSIVTFFQDSSYYDLTIPQTDFKTLLEHSALSTFGYDLNQDYTIASTLTIDQIEKLLSRVIFDHKLIAISSLEPIAHALALYKDDNDFHYYDPNMPEGEIVTESTREIAQEIFNSYLFNGIQFPAIGFIIYDFINLSCSVQMFSPFGWWNNEGFSPIYEDNAAAKKAFIYPNQKNILHELQPSPEEGALLQAAFIGCLNSLEYFLQKNVSVNAVLKKNNATSLMLASQNGYFNIVSKLLAERADHSLQDTTGKTALMLAALRNFTAISNELFKYNADPNAQDKENMTALILAVNSKSIPMVEQLLKNKADPDLAMNDGRTALILATEKDQPVMVEKLLVSGADPDHKKQQGVTALMVASNIGSIEVVEKLLKGNANPDLQNDDGTTALMIAIQSKNPKVARKILAKRINPDVQAANGATALMLAVQFNYLIITEKLLEKGANPDLQTSDGWTAPMIALQSGNLDIARKILEKNIKPNLQTTEGVTALMIAANKGYKQIVEELLKKGADVNLQDKNGNKAINYANDPKIRKILVAKIVP